MTNAAIYLHPNGFDTSGKTLLGRHSAGESFLRGFVRHADVERFYFWNVAGRPQAELDALVARIETPAKPVEWIGQNQRGRLATPGVANLPTPSINDEAWRRRVFGTRAYSICGLTHTTATTRVMRLIPDLLVAPVEDYDALICTSTAVRDSVELQLRLMREYMGDEYGPRRRGEPQRATIPLGVNVDDFAVSGEQRRAWREQLDIPQDALVVLFVGRFSVRTKMNPALMAMALERAAQRTDKRIYWVNSGWGESAQAEAVYHQETRKLCPSVEYRTVDGRQPHVRFSIWSVGDIFISFSDNIQETFGLTPVEAMAAGLPSVVTDWNGYKDTVRHGLEGFRVPTLTPPPGYGVDLAFWLAHDWMTYDNYVGAAAQLTAIDLDAAETAILRLVENDDLRRIMGAAAQARARAVFDWSVIIPQYQALWAELDARRRAAAPDPTPRSTPLSPDPFLLFRGYATRHLSRDDIVALQPQMDWPTAKARLDAPLAIYSRFQRPTHPEVAAVIGHLAEHGPASVARLLELVPEGRRSYLARGLIWLARHDVVTIRPAGG